VYLDMVVWRDEFQAILFSLIGGARYGIKVRLPHALVMTTLFRPDWNAQQKCRNIVKLVQEHATNLASFAVLYKSILLILKYLSCQLTLQPANANVGIVRYCGRLLLSMLGMPIATVFAVHPARILTFSMSFLFSLSQCLKVFGRLCPTMETNGSNSIPSLVAVGYPRYSHHALIAGSIGGYVVWGRYSSINYQIVLYLTSRVLVGICQRLLRQQEQPTNSSTNAISIPPFVKDRMYSISAAAVWGIVMYLFEDSPEVLHQSLKASMDEIYRFRPRSSLVPVLASFRE
jgi:hypothetical protein